MRLHEKLAWYWFAKVSFPDSSRVPPRKEIQFWQPSLRTIFEPKPMPHTMTQSSWTTSLWWPKTCDYFAVFPEKSFKSQLEMHFGIYLDGCVWGSTLTRQMWKKLSWHLLMNDATYEAPKDGFLIVYFLKGPQRQICPSHTSTISDDWVYNPGKKLNKVDLWTYLSIRNDQPQSTLIVIRSMFLICR